MQGSEYPLRFSVDYPDRELNRLTSFFRFPLAIPILIVLGFVAGATWRWSGEDTMFGAGAGGLLFIAPLLLIVFREKYPRWWFDWNRELLRFINRVVVFLALMDDRYPSTDEEQSVHLTFEHPDVPNELNRWLPLVKWLLAIPHYIVLFLLDIVAVLAVVAAWVAILITGRYPRPLFEYLEGVLRWHNRVIAYAFILVTDEYPPFRIAP